LRCNEPKDGFSKIIRVDSKGNIENNYFFGTKNECSYLIHSTSKQITNNTLLINSKKRNEKDNFLVKLKLNE